MIQVLNELAQVVGWLVILGFATLAGAGLWMKYTVSSNVSPEAKEMAKDLDPNNPVSRGAAEVMFDGILDEVRDLQPDETIRADPEPITQFDWSLHNASQEDVEHILSVLQDAGYYTHPLPTVESWNDKAYWGRECAGVWRQEPDWHIVQFDESGRKDIREQVELSLPEEWRPKA